MKKVTVLGNPISDNHLYGHRAMGKRVIKYMTAKGKAYKKLATMAVKEPYEPYEGDVVVDVKVFFGDKRKRDVHGHLKALLDSFEGILYLDDKQIKVITASKFYNKEMPRVEMTVRSILEMN